MQTNYEAEQLSIYDLDSWCGRTFPEPSPAERQKEKTSGVSSKRSSELKSVVFQSLDLTPGHGNLLGESYWELISPWRGDVSTLNYVKLRIIELMCRTEQEGKTPKYSSAKVQRSLQVTLKEGVTKPKRFEDYDVQVTPLDGVTLQILS